MSRNLTESRVFGSDTWQATEGLFDNAHNAWQSLTTPVIELDPCQVVCGDCRLTYNRHLDACPECATT